MVFQDILQRDLEQFERQRYLIYLPVKYFIRRFWGFFIWYLIAGFCAYHFVVVNSLFCWAYAGITLAVFVQIWELFRLSKTKLYIFIAVLHVLGLLAGTGLRLLTAQIILLL